MQLRNRTAVLALGGGGARGLAHIGAIEVLRSLDLRIERYVGVSIGSLVGALCAIEPDSEKLHAKVNDYLHSEGFLKMQAKLFAVAPKSEASSSSGIFSWYETVKQFVGTRRKLIHILSRPSLLARDVMQHVVEGLLPDANIEDLDQPLNIVTVDLRTGSPVVLDRGPLREAVIASTAIPGIFPAVPWDDMLLCDIGVLDPVPSRMAQRYASDLTIAIDVCAGIKHKPKVKNAFETFIRMNEIAQGLMRQTAHESADLMIRPDVARVPWFDFTDSELLIGEGRKAAQSMIQKMWQNAA
ncbi:NTE family protein RssA [Rosistilla oblonga]|uniref:NTE family protein RssA n=1 Tax=Rosistilla oblonga TaxID=2527990 RepID=A0A518IYB8_9BACT|nr:patatin-like phospholipase family protein [Rosistilla oblonga]QDV13729.1 NTE family protein RssA [Rosistilla oblonga]QDV58083.1 NTE family protein RssA [Rosistilla oblonga]